MRGISNAILGICGGPWLTIGTFCLLSLSANTRIIFALQLLGVKSCACPLAKLTKPQAQCLSFVVQDVQKQIMVHTEFRQPMPVGHGEE